MGGKGEGFFRRNIYVDTLNLASEIEKFRNENNNVDIYLCAYRYENQDNIEKGKLWGAPYLDFDCEDIEDNYDSLKYQVKYVINYIESSMGIPAEELNIYFSGHKGFHITIPGMGTGIEEGAADLNQYYKYFAEGLNYILCGKNKSYLDTGIYDRRRLFRIVNSINSKSGRYKVPVTVDQIYDYGYKEIIEWSKAPHEDKNAARIHHLRASSLEGFENIISYGMRYEDERNGVSKSIRRRRRLSIFRKREGEEEKKQEILPCTFKLLEEGAEIGTRNNSAFTLASSLFQAGYNYEETEEIIEEWNETKNAAPISSRELSQAINSAKNSYDRGMEVGCGRYRDMGLCVEQCKLLSSKSDKK